MGELLANHHGVEVEVVESMEMAPGVDPRPDRVPEQDLLTPRNLVSMAAARQNFSWKMIDSFRVFASGGYK